MVALASAIRQFRGGLRFIGPVLASSILVAMVVFSTADAATAAPSSTVTLTPVTGASPSPLTSGNVCNYSIIGISGGWVCFQIFGSGNYVDHFTTDQVAYDYELDGHLEVTGPGYTENYPDDGNTLILPGYQLGWQLNVERDLATGTYCGNWWEYLGGNDYELWDSACNGVHP